jgi:hypothetical protein
MEEFDYTKTRLDHQIEWFDTNSKDKQKWYKRYRNLEIFFAALIPVLGLLFEVQKDWLDGYHSLILGGLGVIISALASILALGKYQELWQTYRMTCESLKKEKYLYLSKARPYHKQDRDTLLAERVESLISKENTNWAEIITSKEDK